MYLSLSSLKDAHPAGEYRADHGCYYFVDQDNDLGYYIQYNDGKFEDEANWVDIDTLDEVERADCENVLSLITSRM